jgi:HEAT repeat protein
MRKDHRWFRNPVLTGIALLGAIASMLWAWQVTTMDMEVSQRAERLRSRSGDVQMGALAELSLLVSVQPEHTAAAFPLVLEATNDHNPLVRAQALLTLGDVARPLTTGGLDSVARQVARTTILNHLSDPSPEVRRSAAGSLARLGPVPAEALGLLARLATDRTDVELRSVAIERLSQMERQTPEALAVIREALNDSAPYVRARAVASLGRWVPTNPDAARAVFARLGDPDPEVRSSVRRLFVGTQLVPPRETLPDLIALLDLPDQVPGTIAAVVLPRMEGGAPAAALPLLTAIRRGLSSGKGLGPFGAHLAALRVMEAEGPVASQTRALLCQCLLENAEPGSRQFAAWCLSKYGQHAGDSLPALQEALKDPDEQVRHTVRKAIDAIEADRNKVALRSVT